MKLLVCFFLIFGAKAWAQLQHTVELSERLNAKTEADARSQLLHVAVMKSVEKFAPELGFEYTAFKEKLEKKFEEAFTALKERKLEEKFGKDHRSKMTEAERDAALKPLEDQSFKSFVRYARLQSILSSQNVEALTQDPKDAKLWLAKVSLQIDKEKLKKYASRAMAEKKPFSKVYLISVLDPFQFTWKDLNLENEKGIKEPLMGSWLKWLHEHLPATVEEVVECDSRCLSYYTKWTETPAEELQAPVEYAQGLFLSVSFHLRRKVVQNSLSEVIFEWEGRALLQDVANKRPIGSTSLPMEFRRFRGLDQNLVNSSLASSIYKSAIPAFMDFNKKLEELGGQSRAKPRSSKLLIEGYKNIGDVLALNELIKARGKDLGLEIKLDSFSKDRAQLVCYYLGEEKSFTDLLSGIKELKSSHQYGLVSEFTGVHHIIKLVTY